MILTRLAIAVLFACASPTALAQSASPSLPEGLLDELRRSSGVTGMAAAVSRKGEVVWHAESGFADAAARTPVNAATEFRLGSVSKFVTIAMLARLVDESRIDLDRPVHAYLPDFPAKEHSFTSRQLATHTAGIPHYDPTLDENIDGAPAPYVSVREGLRVFQDRPLKHAPGSKYMYSSFGYNLLSAVMEQAAGREFTDLLAETARRAGAASLQAERMGAQGKHWSKLYDAAGAEIPRQNVTYKWAGGGLLSNASDLSRLGTAVLDPAFIRPATFARFVEPASLANGDSIKHADFPLGTGWRLGTDQAGRDYVHHSGAIPGGRANLSVYPREGAAIALLGNVQAVIAMEPSSEALYDAWRARPAAGQCREGRRSYSGSYDGQEISGTVTTRRQGRFCRSTLAVDNHFGKRVAPGRQDPQIVGLGRASDGPVYLVTPVGIFGAQAKAGTLSAQVLGKPLQLSLK